MPKINKNSNRIDNKKVNMIKRELEDGIENIAGGSSEEGYEE